MLEQQFQMLSIESKNDDDSVQFESMVKKHVESQVDIITKNIVAAEETGQSQFIYNERNGFLPYVYLVRKWRYGRDNVIASFTDNNYKRCIVGEVISELEKRFADIAVSVDLERVSMLIDWS